MTEWPALELEIHPDLRKYVEETLRHTPAPAKGQLLPRNRTRQGWLVVTVPWLVVPGYDLNEVCAGQPDEVIRREVCLDWTATTGKRVYPEFSTHFHVSQEMLPFYPDDTIYVGWDLPGHPAAVVTQLNPYGQWCLLSSVSPPEGKTVGVYEFGEMVAHHLYKCYAEPNGITLNALRLLHYGDPAGFALPPRVGEVASERAEARSCYDILELGERLCVGHDKRGEPIYEERPGRGWRVMPGGVSITEREEAIRARLRTVLDGGRPALIVCKSAETLREAFGGGHHCKQLADGRYEPKPHKGFYSHTANAAEYIATRLFEQSPKKKDAARQPARREWRSGANTQSRRRG